MAASLTVVGVRHHSPACARLVRSTIRRERPRFVLIEGPADMNARIDELALAHSLPIAIFSYLTREKGSRATWCPFCAYSPEWVALETAREVGATPLFIDLPAWHDAFWEVKNRYSDRHAKTSDASGKLAEKLGVDDLDAMWDHLFEQPCDDDALRARLRVYFEAIRAGDPPGARDVAREAYMRRWIAWALGEASDGSRGEESAVVVCGGYHAPELEKEAVIARSERAAKPEIPIAEGRGGSYLVPYSFRRLDSFVGYDAGMPSPEYHQVVWERGADEAADEMLARSIARLREKRQRVSAADAIAASVTTQALRDLRGHAAIGRVDLLDGLAASLLKEALEAPLPWSRRGKLARGTDPILVEIVAAFSGDRVGTLAAETPRPPLVADAFAEIARVKIPFARAAAMFTPRLDDAEGADASRVLHRLRVLGAPGIRWERAPSQERGKSDLREAWKVERIIDLEPALIEAAAYGSTLEEAAIGKLEEALVAEGANLGVIASLLHDAARVGAFRTGASFGPRVLAEVRARVWSEPSLAVVGRVLREVFGLYRYDALFGAECAPALGEVLTASFDRALWLVEGVHGAKAEVSRDDVAAIVACRDLVHVAKGDPSLAIEALRADAVMARRATDGDAPPALRGAALGFRWAIGALGSSDTASSHAREAIGRVAAPSTFGDFLGGLFALAREEVMGGARHAHARDAATPGDDALLRAVDAVIATMPDDDLLIALPSLRLAFSWFPPHEKEAIAYAVAAMHGSHDARALLRLDVDGATLAEAAKLEARVDELARRYALEEEA